MEDGTKMDLNLKHIISEEDWKEAAKDLNCEVAVIKAVAEVESPGSGFLPDGRLKILFEAKQFSLKTGHQFDVTHPNVSSPVWDRKLYKGGAKEYDRLDEARRLNLTAALESCSWGRFQIMGSNHKSCGFNSVEDFVDFLSISETNHLKCFVKFILSNSNLVKGVQQKNWALFAAAYNGPKYRLNKYDTNLALAYNKFNTKKG